MGSKPMCKASEKEQENEVIQDNPVKQIILIKRAIPSAALRDKQAQLLENSPLPEKADTDIDELTLHFRELELQDRLQQLRFNKPKAGAHSLSQGSSQRSNYHISHIHSNPQIRPIKGILKQHGQGDCQKLHKSVQFQRNTHPKLNHHERVHHQVLSQQFRANLHYR